MYKKRYFKGWYFKCCTGDKTIGFIPSYHCINSGKSALLQIITDDTSYSIPFTKIQYRERSLEISLGDCAFSKEGISLNIANEKVNIEGSLAFRSICPIRYDIMGPFKLVPFMQCRHSVYSMMHQVQGQVIVGNEKYDFANGLGYIEGDSGYSFPKRYIWTQCLFEKGSLMLSVADIPFCGFEFTGIIGVVLLDGKEYRIATYLGAKVKLVSEDIVIVKQGKFELMAKLIKRNAKPLLAPEEGHMSRTIYESASCKAYYRFSHGHKVLCEFTSDRAGFEFEYY